MKELENINSEKLFTSKYLVEQINLFRKEEGNPTEVRHSDFLSKIEKEFEEEIAERKISPSSYLDLNNQSRKQYELSFEQALQVLMSESKTVRKKCVEVMKAQQKQIEELKSFNVPKNFKEALLLAVEQQETIEKQEQLLLEQKPKVEFYDDVADGTGSFDMQEVSAMLKLKFGRNTLFKKLRDNLILMDDNLPYRQYIDSVYFVVVETKWTNTKTQQTNIIFQTRITQKGLDWLSKNKSKFSLK